MTQSQPNSFEGLFSEATLNFGSATEAKRDSLADVQESPRQTKPKKGQFVNFSRGYSGTKVRCESCLFGAENVP